MPHWTVPGVMDVEIVLFPGFDELDGVGPYEVFRMAADRGADLSARMVTRRPADHVEASHGLRIEPDGTLGSPDLLVVPGGGWADGGAGVREEVEDGRLPDAVSATHDDGATIASVCTGAMVLAHAGLLDGRPATTHPVAFEDLEAVTERVDARVVDDGDVLTAGGVTSGIDLALWLLEREFDRDVADEVAADLVFERRGEVHRRE